jgi:polyisoprenyl-teichoic acid--peptidoglycan teichoic acid transferase
VSLLPHSRRGALWRFLLAALIVVSFTATATAVAGLLKVKQFVAELNFTQPLPHARVVIPKPGEPQTLLLIGSDHRAGESFKKSNTDTMMLVRIDAKSSTINVLSVPRDLKVQLPYGNVMGSGKLNSAYSLGGPNLLVKTLHDQVFPGLKVNHIIDVNFGGFKALINAVGCVYADVDRRYFHVSAPDAADNYSSIDIQPGYQKLCGDDALSFVRFRHLDNDLVRNARQQDFLRWAKSQFSQDTILSQQDKLLTIFGKHAQTDSGLHTTDGLINLFDQIALSAGHTVKQIPFPAVLLPCNGNPQAQTPCYVQADPRALGKAFGQFMAPTLAKAKPAGGGHGGHGGGSRAARPALLGDLLDGKSQASLLGNAGMPVYVPAKIAAGTHYCAPGLCAEGPIQNSYPRAYRIKDQSGHARPAYRMTLVLNPVLGQYYGVQGTTWGNPPILAGAHETRSVSGKQLALYFNGGKLTLVAWHTPGGVYWISNSLTDDLTNGQMVAIAASLTHS